MIIAILKERIGQYMGIFSDSGKERRLHFNTEYSFQVSKRDQNVKNQEMIKGIMYIDENIIQKEDLNIIFRKYGIA